MIARLNISYTSIIPLVPLFLLITIAVLAPVLSNNIPLLVIGDGGIQFPLAKENSAQFQLHGDEHFMLYPPIPYLPTDIDIAYAAKPPFTRPANKAWYYTHWLGTDELGRDVLSHLIYGCRTSVTIAVGAMALAFILGLSIGAIGGYWHNRSLKSNLLLTLTALALLILFVNIINVLFIRFEVEWALILGLIIAFTLISSLFLLYSKINKLNRNNSRKLRVGELHLSPDITVVGLINFFTAIPAYFALLTLLAIWPNPSTYGLSIILGILMWPDLARLTRSQVVKLRSTALAESAESLGYSPWRIMFGHLLPNALQPALAALSFGIGGAIMAESFLSFVGIAPAEMISWGTLLAKTRTYPELWWLSVFPGIAILFAILTFYRLSSLSVKLCK